MSRIIEQVFNNTDVKFLTTSYVSKQLGVPEKDAELFLKRNPKIRDAYVVTEDGKALYALKSTPVKGIERFALFLKNISCLYNPDY